MKRVSIHSPEFVERALVDIEDDGEVAAATSAHSMSTRAAAWPVAQVVSKQIERFVLFETSVEKLCLFRFAQRRRDHSAGHIFELRQRGRNLVICEAPLRDYLRADFPRMRDARVLAHLSLIHI